MATYLEDIFSQPISLKHCIVAQNEAQRLALSTLCSHPWKRVLFTGMGSSNYCAIPAVQYLMQHGHQATRYSAADVMNYCLPAIDPDTLLVVNSQSGESIEVTKLLEHLPKEITVLAVTNDPESTLTKAATISLHINAIPEKSVTTRTYINSIVLNLLIAHAICSHPLTIFLAEAKKAADAMEICLKSADNIRDAMMRELVMPSQLCFLGRGCSFTTACAGTLFTREVSRHPAFFELCGEFRHGPMEMVDDSFNGILIAGIDPTFHLQNLLAHDIKAHGGHLIVIANEAISCAETIIVPQISDWLSPLITILPIQLYVDQLAKQKGIEAGTFRWGTKITRTE